MPESSDWILKIISGPHQGVEEVFPEGRLVVGTGPGCGIILHDVLIAPEHFALNRQGAKVTVEPLAGRVYCQGKRATGPTAVPEFSFLTAGTTHLVVGPANANWPLLSPADIPDLERTPPPSPPPPAATPPSDATSGPEPVEPAKAGKPDGENPALPTAAQRRRAWWMAGIGMVLLALWLVLWLLLKPLPEPARRPSAADRAEKIVGALPPGNRVRVELRGDQLSVSGYVDSDARQRDLVAAFRAEVPEANLRVWSTPRLAETARSFLADRKLDLKVEAGDPGELTISGSVPSGPLWTTARQMLLAEVPGLQKITDEVRIAGDKPAEKGPAAAAPRSPDAGYKVVAVQTLPEGPAWVRLSDGSVLFASGRLGAAMTFTGVEKGKARFDSPAGSVLAGVGETISLPPSPPPRPAAPDAATRSATPLRDVPEPRPAPASPLPSAQTPAAPAEGPPAASGASAVVPPPGADAASAANSAPAANPPATPAPAPAPVELQPPPATPVAPANPPPPVPPPAAPAEPPPGPSGAPAAPPAGANAAPSANPVPGANPPVTPAPEAAPTEVPAPPPLPASPESPSTPTPPPSTEIPAAPPRPSP